MEDAIATTQARHQPDIAVISRFWNLITAPGEVRELRAPKTTQGTISGYYDNTEAFSRDAARLSGKAPGVYTTINPVNPELLARASNRSKTFANLTVSDSDILFRHFVLIDIDPVRPSGISSTDAEQAAATERAEEIAAYLVEQGSPPESLLEVSTGNGAAFWLQVDLANDNKSTELVKHFLESLDFQFSDSPVKVDTSVYNAARIAKIPGTMACKGDSTIERPHRVSSILNAPDVLLPCPTAVLEAVAARLPVKPSAPPRNGHRIDAAEWLAKHTIPVRRSKEWNGGRVFEIPCQWNPEHNRGEAFVVQFDNGAVCAGCHHNSCQGKTWADLRELHEPAYRERRYDHLEYTENADNTILTDTTNAELIAQLYGNRLRYDHLRGRWLTWAGHYWQEDLDGEVYRLAVKTTRERYKRSVSIEDLKERQRVANWAIASEQRGRLEAAVALAKNIKPIADSGADWDSDPWLFAMANGIIDLRTGKRRDGKREDRTTMHSNVVHDPEAECPRWIRFLDEVFDGDAELIDWVRRALGYSMTGITTEQVFINCYGTGANGKSKFQSAIREVFGDYAYDAPFSTFELNTRAAIPNDLAALERRRLVTSSETNDGTRLNEARIKALSGEDPCTARYLHREFFTFRPVCKIWMLVNHKPTVRDDSYGFWRRVRLVPFLRQFKGSDEDRNLGAKLLAEAPGILNWVITGCLEWQKRGLDPVPAAVTAATEAYKTESDPLAEFITGACVVIPNAVTKASVLYKAYVNWAIDQGIHEKERLTNTAFGKRMRVKHERRDRNDGAYYHGIGLKSGEFGGEFTHDFAENDVSSNINKPRGEYMKTPPLPTTPATGTLMRRSTS